MYTLCNNVQVLLSHNSQNQIVILLELFKYIILLNILKKKTIIQCIITK